MAHVRRPRTLHRRARWTVLTCALAVAGLAPVTGVPGAAAAAACWGDVATDVDGGGPDVVLGLPSYDLPGKPDAGALVIFSNVGVKGEADPRPPTAARVLTADDVPGLSSQTGARFGAAVSLWLDAGTTDDPDDCADLIVGVPGQDVAGKDAAGQVVWLKGAAGGVAAVVRTLDEARLPGTGGAQAGARFGSAIAVQTYGLAAVGAPGRNVGSVVDAGRVVLLDYTRSRTDPGVRVVGEGNPGAGSAEKGDRFGEVLRLLPTGKGDVLLVGVPHEDVGSSTDAGSVMLLPPGGRFSTVTQNSPGAGGAAEAGDRYGASLDAFFTYTTHAVGVVAIGVPGEDIGSRTNAGLVSFASFDFGQDLENDPIEPLAGRARTITQDTARVPGAAERGDAFGASVLVGEFGRDGGQDDLVVGAPGEDLGAADGAGMLTSVAISPDGVVGPASFASAWHQDSPSVPGVPEDGDRFASRLSPVGLTSYEDDDDSIWDVVLVTVPGEDVSGVVDAGTAYLGVSPGKRSVPLTLPVRQRGAGIGMVPMRVSG